MLTVLAVAGCSRPVSAEKAKEAPRVTVAHPLVRSLVDEDDYNGWLEASQTVELRARVRGHILKIHFKDGDLVKKDQLLFELDPRPFQAAIDEALADVDVLKAQQIGRGHECGSCAVSLFKSKAMSASDIRSRSWPRPSRTPPASQQKRRPWRGVNWTLNSRASPLPSPAGSAKRMLTEGNLVNAGGSDPLLTTIVAIDPIYVDFNVDERAMQGTRE